MCAIAQCIKLPLISNLIPLYFMHLIWVNLIHNLILLWSMQFKDLDHNGLDDIIMQTVWKEIGEATSWAGRTIPAAFGSQVPNTVGPMGSEIHTLV